MGQEIHGQGLSSFKVRAVLKSAIAIVAKVLRILLVDRLVIKRLIFSLISMVEMIVSALFCDFWHGTLSMFIIALYLLLYWNNDLSITWAAEIVVIKLFH